jgi:hypothetical protein
MNKLFPVPGPGESLETIEMTDERKQRVNKACSELVDWLMAHTQNPAEGLMVLDFVSTALSQKFGIRARTFISKSDMGAQA